MTNFALEMINENLDKIKLSIIPLDEHTARLIEVVGEKKDITVFSRLGKYEGFNHYSTSNELKIYKAIFEGREYDITQIQSCTFSHCRDIKDIIIGPLVSIIDWNMYQCISLENIFVDANNAVYHDKSGVLYKGDELVAFPQGRIGHYVVPTGTIRIGNHAFKSCHLTSIAFPETLEEIGINAFYDCKNISEFILPSSIKHVYSNCNQGNRPITQKFYLSSDTNKINPLSIEDIIKLFPA